jgi:hypothetical protein
MNTKTPRVFLSLELGLNLTLTFYIYYRQSLCLPHIEKRTKNEKREVVIALLLTAEWGGVVWSQFHQLQD